MICEGVAVIGEVTWLEECDGTAPGSHARRTGTDYLCRTFIGHPGRSGHVHLCSTVGFHLAGLPQRGAVRYGVGVFESGSWEREGAWPVLLGAQFKHVVAMSVRTPQLTDDRMTFSQAFKWLSSRKSCVEPGLGRADEKLSKG